MPCPDCEGHATPEQVFEMIQQHHARLEAEYTRRLEEAVAEIRRLAETLAAATETRPPGTPIH